MNRHRGVRCPLAEVEARGLDTTCLCDTQPEHEAAHAAVVRGVGAAAFAGPAAAAVLAMLAIVAGYVRGRRAARSGSAHGEDGGARPCP